MTIVFLKPEKYGGLKKAIKMNTYQRHRRTVFWCGSFPVLVGFTILMLALIVADQAASLNPQNFDGIELSQQTSLQKLKNHKAESSL
ncbi:MULTISPECIES: hypothetical protein [unclassified Pseudomonas]|uniref:hypothetical protein n=1 Tax=unclassified Pseudomonas TaxID=196821 RepID=UPI00128ADFCF|nr:hypothetical protein [Pseudomonas sp. ES3-33]